MPHFIVPQKLGSLTFTEGYYHYYQNAGNESKNTESSTQAHLAHLSVGSQWHRLSALLSAGGLDRDTLTHKVSSRRWNPGFMC